jgi:hypothetical protein
LLVKGKKEVIPGIEAVRELVKRGYRVIIVIGSEEMHRAAYLEMFPILQEAGVEVVFGFKSESAATFTQIQKTAPSPNYIFVHGKKHQSIETAKNAGCLPIHYDNVLNICRGN